MKLRCRVCGGEISERLGSLAIGRNGRYYGNVAWIPLYKVRRCLTCSILVAEEVDDAEKFDAGAE